MRQLLHLLNSMRLLWQIMHDICVIIKNFKKGGNDMVDFYTYLVISELKKFKEVPKFLKEPVKARIVEIGDPKLLDLVNEA